MTQDFLCAKCLQRYHPSFLAYQYGINNNLCCCKDCDKGQKEANIKETSQAKKDKHKPSELTSAYVEKRRDLEMKHEIDRLMGAYELENLI